MNSFNMKNVYIMVKDHTKKPHVSHFALLLKMRFWLLTSSAFYAFVNTDLQDGSCNFAEAYVLLFAILILRNITLG